MWIFSLLVFLLRNRWKPVPSFISFRKWLLHSTNQIWPYGWFFSIMAFFMDMQDCNRTQYCTLLLLNHLPLDRCQTGRGSPVEGGATCGEFFFLFSREDGMCWLDIFPWHALVGPNRAGEPLPYVLELCESYPLIGTCQSLAHHIQWYTTNNRNCDLFTRRLLGHPFLRVGDFLAWIANFSWSQF